MGAPLVRIGLVGYGKGGRLFHAPLIGHAEGCVLGGVVVWSPERRAALAADLPDVPVAGSLAELADAGVDAVVVTTPLDSHVELVREAVGLGLPVVCDKPFARDATAARATVLAAERSGVLLSVYQNRRWDADFRTVQQVVTAGAIGEVLLFESRMEQPPQPEGLPVTGGGALLDLGSHAIDQALHLFGPVRSVYAELRTAPAEVGFDEGFFVVLRHDGGVTSHVTGNWARQGDVGSRFRVDGAAATLVVPDDDGQTAADGRTDARVGRSRVGHGPREPVGRCPPRRRRRPRALAARRLERLLHQLRARRPRERTAPGRPLGRGHQPRGARCRTGQRGQRPGGRAQCYRPASVTALQRCTSLFR
jgi:predicted dehydrogenase